LLVASCSPATSAAGSLTPDVRAGSSAAPRRCARRPSDISPGCWPVASAPGGSASTRSKITRSSSASRSSPSQFAVHLDQQGVRDWATCSRSHIEAFLATGRDRGFRLAALRDFFRFARKERICLADPTAGLAHRPARGFRGQTLPRGDQAQLLRRWAGGDCHPHEALVGLLSLLHGASVSELRALTVTNVNTATRTVRLGRRPHRVPLDPLTFAALERSLEHRQQLRTENPHVIVTRGTRAHRAPACQPYLSHVLDAASVSPRLLRQTRLAELTHRLDPRLVAATFGMTPEGALHYLIGAVDSEAAAFANL
jgi:site-specific recombinase XerD